MLHLFEVRVTLSLGQGQIDALKGWVDDGQGEHGHKDTKAMKVKDI